VKYREVKIRTRCECFDRLGPDKLPVCRALGTCTECGGTGYIESWESLYELLMEYGVAFRGE
jgi:hypothetical protein